MGAILEAQGQELELLLEALTQILDQQFVLTATWGLTWWERLLRLPVSESLPVAERRNRVLTKRRGVTARLLTVLRALAPALQVRFGGDVISFVLPTEHNANEYDFAPLVPILEVRKPAHKAYAFQLLPPDGPSGYVVYGGHRVRFKVSLEPEAGAVYAGRWPRWNVRGVATKSDIIARMEPRAGLADYYFAGVSRGARIAGGALVLCARVAGLAPYRACGMPEAAGQGAATSSAATVAVLMKEATQPFRSCGTFRAGEAA
jgi:hypothetical protein